MKTAIIFALVVCFAEAWLDKLDDLHSIWGGKQDHGMVNTMGVRNSDTCRDEKHPLILKGKGHSCEDEFNICLSKRVEKKCDKCCRNCGCEGGECDDNRCKCDGCRKKKKSHHNRRRHRYRRYRRRYNRFRSSRRRS